MTELAARTTAFESSDVRPQVTGVIRRRLFTEGTLVKRGQPLYEIDPRLYRASVNQAGRQSAKCAGQCRGDAHAGRTLSPAGADRGHLEAGLYQRAGQRPQAAAQVAQTRAALGRRA